MLEVSLERARAGCKVALVNAASAYHLGGGFFDGGRHALEESLCMQSTLYKSLRLAADLAKAQNVRAPAYAQPGRARDGYPWECHIPEDGAVLSPDIDIFRGSTFDGYPFFDGPVQACAVISV